MCRIPKPFWNVMDTLRLLILPASAREASLNRRLAAVAAAAAPSLGLQPSTFDLHALDLPIYHGDLEAASGIPPGAHRLREAIAASDALLVVTPEYNGFPTPLFINAFDWLSRIQPRDGQPSGLATTANKPVGLLSASTGPGGGLRSMNYVRQYLQMAFAMIVVPQQFALGRANEAFGEDGALKDPKAAQSVANVLQALGRLANALRA